MTNQSLGIILAGGGSRRMGQDKTSLMLDGRPMIEHMVALLEQIGVSEIIVSGDVPGYRYATDDTPGNGPARAIMDIINNHPGFQRYLAMPVDMPLFPIALGQMLLKSARSGYFEASILPICLHGPAHTGEVVTMRELGALYGAEALPTPLDLPPHSFLNINTPEEYEIAARAFAGQVS
ncbi:MAG: NTP transferase domain-containing protein [Alphaproteobacteria bacterium]|nr:NTP transferase domain-containing protein [Alphaproteobacteria bacterium SS10]